jgi:hypothetical protein
MALPTITGTILRKFRLWAALFSFAKKVTGLSMPIELGELISTLWYD